VAVTPDGCWRVSHEAVSGGNPVGAGDALVAGLALNVLAEGVPAEGVPDGRAADGRVPSDWPTALRRASGLAMASVLAASAGEVDPVAAEQFAGNVRIRKIRGPDR
jgi:tagatose 6-phosphate kinase